MLPEGSHKMIRSVRIYYFNYIMGFRFFDKEGALILKIGITDSWLYKKKVLIAENEVIVGVVAKLHPLCIQFAYTDFQFQIAARWEWNKKAITEDN